MKNTLIVGLPVLYVVPKSEREHNNHQSVAPALISAVHSDTCVNLRVFFDGHRTEWKTSVVKGDGTMGHTFMTMEDYYEMQNAWKEDGHENEEAMHTFVKVQDLITKEEISSEPAGGATTVTSSGDGQLTQEGTTIQVNTNQGETSSSAEPLKTAE